MGDYDFPIVGFLFIVGLIVGGFVIWVIMDEYIDYQYKIPMKSLGIEKFQKCEINTTNCHSNWYEIIYKK